MTIKKKLLIALLSTTCVAAGAAGLAACKDNKPADDPAYTVTAVDQYGNAVAGVIFRIGYYDAKSYTTNFIYGDDGKILTATSDKNGKATFKGFTPEEDVSYNVYLAEADLGQRAYPYGYRNSTNSVDFDENWHATYNFMYAPSSYYDNIHYGLTYKRTFNDERYDGNDTDTMEYVEEGSNKLTLSLKKDVHTYFSFMPYKELGGSGEEADYNNFWSSKAAAGVYKITYTTSPATAANMYYFDMSYVITDFDLSDDGEVTDKKGIPAYPLDEAEGTTGSIELTLTAYGNYARASQGFGVYASSDCNITVTVERLGDAEEPAEIPVTVVEVPKNLTKQTTPDGKLTEADVNGSIEAVLGNDGYYHINSKTGPVLYATLTTAISRVSDLSIMDMADKDKNEEGYTMAHVLSEYDKGELKGIYDYSEFLKEYAKNVNSDGLYPVDEDLYTFLHRYAGRAITPAPKPEYNWLLPCQYYAPAEGLEVTGEGTEAKPYVLLELLNKVNSLSGSEAYFTYTATTDGIFSFTFDDSNKSAVLSVVGDGIQSFEEQNANGAKITHVILKENQTVSLKLTGFEASATIDVANAAKNTVKAEFGGDTDSKGTNEGNAIQLTKVGYTAFIVDDSVYSEGVWVYVQPLGFAGETFNYTFKIKSPLAQIVYGSETYGYGDTLSLTCKAGEKYAFLLTAKDGEEIVNGVYAIECQVSD